MKKRYLTVALVCAIAASLTCSSCIGSFSLTNKLLAWNQGISNKFVNELVFIAFLIVPVYEISSLADILVLNSIEFWSGTSPVAQGKSIIKGTDGDYLVECDGKGYSIKSLNDGSVVRLNFNVEEQTWSVVGNSGVEYPLVTFVDQNNVLAPNAAGEMVPVSLTQEGLWAYQSQMLNDNNYAAR